MHDHGIRKASSGHGETDVVGKPALDIQGHVQDTPWTFPPAGSDVKDRFQHAAGFHRMAAQPRRDATSNVRHPKRHMLARIGDEELCGRRCAVNRRR